MRRWLRRRRADLMHRPVAVGGHSRAWLWFGLLSVALALAWALRERTLANTDVARMRQAYAIAQSEWEAQADELQQLRQRVQSLEATLAQQRETVSEAQAVSQTAQSQSLADQAAQDELARQMRVLQQENGRLKQDLAFFQSAIPKGGVKGGLALRRFEAQRIAPTQVRWQALVVQPIKNAEPWQGTLNIVLSGELDGQPWTQSPVAGPTRVSLIQFVRLEGVMTIPPEAKLLSISAKLLKDQRVVAVQTFKF